MSCQGKQKQGILKLIFKIKEVFKITLSTRIGDVANSKRPLLIIPKVQPRLHVTSRSATVRLRVTRRSWQKLFAGKNFVKILVTA